MSSEKEGFVSRWSRRKQEVAKTESEQALQDIDTSDTGAENDHPQHLQQDLENDIDPAILKAEKLEALNQLTDEDMPDIETLDEHSDFSGFMSTSVSEGLRSMALKKLFMGKSYNIRDGLDEYDGDYTKFEKMPSTMVTSDMKHMVEVEAKKQLEKEREEERQRMLAENETEEGVENLDDYDEYDEFADDDEAEELSVAEDAEQYVDEHINVEGFDTTEINDGNNVIEEVSDKGNTTHDNEEVA